LDVVEFVGPTSSVSSEKPACYLLAFLHFLPKLYIIFHRLYRFHCHYTIRPSISFNLVEFEDSHTPTHFPSFLLFFFFGPTIKLGLINHL